MEEQANPLLLAYLELDDYSAKKDFLNLHRMDITQRLLSDIAVCEDIVLVEGTADQMLDSLILALSTKARYEVKR